MKKRRRKRPAHIPRSQQMFTSYIVNTYKNILTGVTELTEMVLTHIFPPFFHIFPISCNYTTYREKKSELENRTLHEERVKQKKTLSSSNNGQFPWTKVKARGKKSKEPKKITNTQRKKTRQRTKKRKE